MTFFLYKSIKFPYGFHKNWGKKSSKNLIFTENLCLSSLNFFFFLEKSREINELVDIFERKWFDEKTYQFEIFARIFCRVFPVPTVY